MTLILFFTFALWLYLIFAWATARRRRVRGRVEEMIIAPRQKPVIVAKPKSGGGIPWRHFARKLTANWTRRGNSKQMQKIHDRLIQAGNPMNLTVAEWLALRIFITLIGAALGILVVILMKGKLESLGLLLVLMMLGWIGPDFWLSRRITQRQGEIRRQFPSLLDMLSVSVEAGLGFDQALSRVSEKMTGPMADEIQRTLREMQLGRPRADSLARMAERVNVDWVQSFVSSVVQAERLGIGLAQVLRVQAADVRNRRRMEAQERAMKAPIKILFPLILFVFPSMFIIILGPAVIHMISVFSSGVAL